MSTPRPSLFSNTRATFRRLVAFGAVISGMALPALAQTPYWSPAPGPYGGAVVSSLVTLSDGTILAASRGGVFRSDDSGKTWESDGEGLLISDVRALLRLDDDRVIAGTYGGGLYARGASQASWIPVGPAGQFVTALGRTGAGTLLAGTIGTLLSSEDDGVTWIPRPLLAVRALASSAQYTFAATSEGVFRSADNGSTWEFSVLGFQNFDVLSLVVNSKGSVFAGGNPTSGACAIYRSRGNGNIWTCIQPQTDPILVSTMIVDDRDRLFAGGYRTVLTSDDEGDSWIGHSAGNSSVNALTSDGSTMVAGTFGFGILRSDDGGNSWISSNTGLKSRVKDLLVDASGTLYSATDGGVFVSQTRGESWSRVGGDDALVQPVTTLLKDDQDRLLAGTLNGVWRFTEADGWVELGPPGRPTIQTLTLGTGGELYVGYYGGLYRLSGTSWVLIPIIGADQAPRSVVAATETADGSLLVGSSWDSWRRSLGETNWSLLAMTGTSFFEVTKFASTQSQLVAGTRFFGVLESKDQGRTWQGLGTGLSGQEDVRSIEYDGAGRLHIGTFGSGIFQLNPWTDVWAPMDAGLDGHLRVMALAFSNGGDAYAGTFGGGLFRHLGTGAVDTEEDPSIPNSTSLQSIYPNPMSGPGTIRFTLSSAEETQIEIFDMLGRRIAQPVNERRTAGQNEVNIDTASWAPGVYVVRLRTGQTMQTSSLVHVQR